MPSPIFLGADSGRHRIQTQALLSRTASARQASELATWLPGQGVGLGSLVCTPEPGAVLAQFSPAGSRGLPHQVPGLPEQPL